MVAAVAGASMMLARAPPQVLPEAQPERGCPGACLAVVSGGQHTQLALTLALARRPRLLALSVLLITATIWLVRHRAA